MPAAVAAAFAAPVPTGTTCRALAAASSCTHTSLNTQGSLVHLADCGMLRVLGVELQLAVSTARTEGGACAEECMG